MLLLNSAAGMAAEAPDDAIKAQTALVRGDGLCDRRLFAEAISQYSEAIAFQPGCAEAFNNRGFARLSNGDARGAIPDFTRALELREHFPHAYNNRGCAYLQEGDSEKAIADFTRAVELDPGYRRAFRNRATAYLRTGNLKLAIADFERAGSHPKRVIGIVVTVLALVVALIAIALYGIVWKGRQRT